MPATQNRAGQRFGILTAIAPTHKTLASGRRMPASSPTGDCAPIDDQYVKEEPDGYHIDLPKGAHPKLLTRGYKTVIPYSDARKQPLDNRYHICLSNDGGYRFCFFPKPGAV